MLLREPRRYKTALCANYRKEGFCAYGARCSFAHGLAELRGPVHPCTVSAKYKTTLCRRFMEEQRCMFGVACSFAHGPEELLTPNEARAMLERLGSSSSDTSHKDEAEAPVPPSLPADEAAQPPVDPVVCPPSRRQQAKQCTPAWRPWDGLLWCSVVSGVVACV
jgi:tristetraprolin